MDVSEREGPGGGASANHTPTLGDEKSRDHDLRRDDEKRESLVDVRARYAEAQKLVSSSFPYGNLEWILGGRRNLTQDPLSLATNTIELIGLWLQDLAVELEQRLPPPSGEAEAEPLSPDAVRQLVAQSLRDATERFLVAFRIRPETAAEEPSPS